MAPEQRAEQAGTEGWMLNGETRDTSSSFERITHGVNTFGKDQPPAKVLGSHRTPSRNLASSSLLPISYSMIPGRPVLTSPLAPDEIARAFSFRSLGMFTISILPCLQT